MHYPEFIPTKLAESIDITVASTASAAGLTSPDCEDLKQEIVRDIFVALDSYDESLSNKTTFAKAVMKNTIFRYLKKGRALKVKNVLAILDAPARDQESGDADSLVETIAAEAPDRDTQDLITDVRLILGMLPPKHRKVCRLIMDGVALDAIPKRVGITEYEFEKKIRKDLQRVFGDIWNFSEKSSPRKCGSIVIGRLPTNSGSVKSRKEA